MRTHDDGVLQRSVGGDVDVDASPAPWVVSTDCGVL